MRPNYIDPELQMRLEHPNRSGSDSEDGFDSGSLSSWLNSSSEEEKQYSDLDLNDTLEQLQLQDTSPSLTYKSPAQVVAQKAYPENKDISNLISTYLFRPMSIRTLIRKNDSEYLRMLFEQNRIAPLGQPVVKYAVQYGNYEWARKFIEAGFPVDNPEHLFELAVESGNLRLVQYLFEKGIRAPLETRRLHPAKTGNLDLVQWLVQQGYLSNQPNTLLRDAVRAGDLKTVQWVFHTFRVEQLPPRLFHLACLSGNLPLVQWLASLTPIPDDSLSVMFTNAVHSGSMTLIKWLIREKGQRLKKSHVPFAILSGSIQLAEWMNTNKFLDTPTEKGSREYLLHAVDSRNPRMLQWLHDKGYKQTSGREMLHAIGSDNLDMVQRVYSLGYVSSMKQEELHTLAASDDFEITDWLLHQGYFTRKELFLTAISMGNIEMVEWLSELGYVPNASEITPIINKAIQSRSLPTLQWVHAQYTIPSFALEEDNILRREPRIVKWLLEQNIVEEGDDAFLMSIIDTLVGDRDAELLQWFGRESPHEFRILCQAYLDEMDDPENPSGVWLQEQMTQLR